MHDRSALQAEVSSGQMRRARPVGEVPDLHSATAILEVVGVVGVVGVVVVVVVVVVRSLYRSYLPVQRL